MADKRCLHYLNHGIVRANMCEKDEYCQYGHLISYDLQIIQAAFNIFIFMYHYREIMPESKEVEDCDFDMKNEEMYKEF